MNKLVNWGVLFSVLPLFGCANYSPGSIHLGTTSFGGPPDEVIVKTGIHFSEIGGININKSQPIRVEHTGSPKLTEYWAERFKAAGFNISAQGELLAVSGFFTARGRFNGIKDPVNTGLVDLDKLSTTPQEDTQVQKSSRYVIGTGGIFAPGASSNLLLASVVDFAFNATGVKGTFADAQNKALGLDKDHLKFCMFGCDAQRSKELQPTQNGVIVLDFKGDRRVVSAISYQPDFDPYSVMDQIEKKLWVYLAL